jgi:Flp pilus assembly protein TadG
MTLAASRQLPSRWRGFGRGPATRGPLDQPACATREPAAAGSDKSHRDEGAATVFVVLLVVALLATAGLVVDGGYLLAARQEAANTAEQAARAGADALSRESLLGNGPLRLDRAAARTEAARFLAAGGHTGEVSIAGDTVTVTVRATRRTAILSAVGISVLTATGSASARGITGISGEDPALNRAVSWASREPVADLRNVRKDSR